MVVSKRLDDELKCKLREVLCTMHQDFLGTRWLKEGLIDRFVPIADEQYQDLREMFARVQQVGFPFE